jgi:hypothetical protein
MISGTVARLDECISQFRCYHELYPANLLKFCQSVGS